MVQSRRRLRPLQGRGQGVHRPDRSHQGLQIRAVDRPLMVIILRFAFFKRRRLLIIKAVLLFVLPLLFVAFPVLVTFFAKLFRSTEVAKHIVG